MTYSYNNSILGDYLTPSGNNLIVENPIIINSGSINNTVIGNSIPSSGYFTNLFSNGVSVSISGHNHTSSDITNFNSSVSGLLPSVTGSGYAASNFANNTYTISVTGLQPSGNYSTVGHTHTASNITDFNSSVSGLLPTISNSGSGNLLVSDGTSTGISGITKLTFDTSNTKLILTNDLPFNPSGTNSSWFEFNTYKDHSTGTNLIDFNRSRGTVLSPSGVVAGDRIFSMRARVPNISGVFEGATRIFSDVVEAASGLNIYPSSRLVFNTSTSLVSHNNSLSLESDGRVLTNGYIVSKYGISAPKPIYNIGTASGNTAISYGVDKQIQNVTLNGGSVNFTEGTNWDAPMDDYPSETNNSVEVLLRINVTSTTTVAFDNNFVNERYDTLPTFTSGIYSILLRSIGSGTVQMFYLGKKL